MDLFGTALGLSIKKSVYPVLAHPIQALNISHYLLFHLSKVVGAGKLCTVPTQDVEGAIGRTTNLSVSERERELSRKREPHLQRPGGMALHHPPG